MPAQAEGVGRDTGSTPGHPTCQSARKVPFIGRALRLGFPPTAARHLQVSGDWRSLPCASGGSELHESVVGPPTIRVQVISRGHPGVAGGPQGIPQSVLNTARSICFQRSLTVVGKDRLALRLGAAASCSRNANWALMVASTQLSGSFIGRSSRCEPADRRAAVGGRNRRGWFPFPFGLFLFFVFTFQLSWVHLQIQVVFFFTIFVSG